MIENDCMIPAYKILEFKIIENVLIKKAEFQLAVNSKFQGEDFIFKFAWQS